MALKSPHMLIRSDGSFGDWHRIWQRFRTSAADFAVLDDWEDRYRYVIELGRTLAPLPEELRTDDQQGARLRQPGLARNARGAR